MIMLVLFCGHCNGIVTSDWTIKPEQVELCLRTVNVLITTRNKIIKSSFIKKKNELTFFIVLYAHSVKFYRRSPKIELFIFAVHNDLGFFAGILCNNSDRGAWDRKKYFHIICYSWLHSVNFESILSYSFELNSLPL